MNDNKDTHGVLDLDYTGALYEFPALSGSAEQSDSVGSDSRFSQPPEADFIMRPRVDVCFKRLMEDEEVCIGFLSAVYFR